jgi:hypothetical protein
MAMGIIAIGYNAVLGMDWTQGPLLGIRIRWIRNSAINDWDPDPCYGIYQDSKEFQGKSSLIDSI